MAGKPIIAIAGLSCETSTFTAGHTGSTSFHIRRGDEILDRYPFLREGHALGDVAKWQGVLCAYALPGPAVAADAFKQLSNEIINSLTRLTQDKPLDGFWFDVHGAMCVEGVEDSESELLRRIRNVIGPDTVITTSEDLHGNVSQDLVRQTDLITCYRTAPHVDVMETKERACRNLIELLQCRRKNKHQSLPIKVWIPVPILLAGEQTSTRMEPAKSLYATITDIESTKGIIDAALWIGYAWADEPRSCATVVVTGWDEFEVVKQAEKLAHSFWDSREEFKFVAPTGSFAKCLEAALETSARPYFISDSGDNPTAGGSGDSTWALQRLLSRPEFKTSSGLKVVYASLPGAEAVDTAVAAGVGAMITVSAGIEPIKISGTVYFIKYGDRHAGIEVVLQIGSIFVILTRRRKPYHLEHDFTNLKLDIRNNIDIAIVKIGYLEPELYNLAADWMLALTPGGVDQDLLRLEHRSINRPMWPFDKFEQEPDLRGRIVERANNGKT